MKNILLIENNDAILNKILGTLDQSEFELSHAESSYKGYIAALKNIPHLVICNKSIFENEIDDSLRKLREDSIMSTIPFVFIVEDGSIKSKDSIKKQAFDYYIKEPFKPKELLNLIKIAFEKYEAVVKKTEKKLEDLRGSISFSLPHEFFTPLNGILGFSDILIKDFDNLTKQEKLEMLEYIHKDGSRLKKLTENFLAYAQLEMIGLDSDKVLSIRRSYFSNPKDMISTIASLIAKEFNREDDLVLEIENASIRMSESYLKKMAGEIIDNAFKFSPKDTSVIVNLLSNDTSVMLSVTDKGRGMKPEHISSIGAYMQFGRKEHEQQGTGLGLIIAKKIAELHGGEFAIETPVDGGTKINIIFEN